MLYIIKYTPHEGAKLSYPEKNILYTINIIHMTETFVNYQPTYCTFLLQLFSSKAKLPIKKALHKAELIYL